MVRYNAYTVQEKTQKLLALTKKYQLQDPRTWGLIAFACMAAALTWSGSKAVQLNFELQKKVSVIEEQNKVQELQNETQKLKNEYYKTSEYKELAARRQFGVAAPGERLYIVPKDLALKYASPEPSTPAVAAIKPAIKLPAYQQNLQDWADFLFHRAPSDL